MLYHHLAMQEGTSLNRPLLFGFFAFSRPLPVEVDHILFRVEHIVLLQTQRAFFRISVDGTFRTKAQNAELS